MALPKINRRAFFKTLIALYGVTKVGPVIRANEPMIINFGTPLHNWKLHSAQERFFNGTNNRVLYGGGFPAGRIHIDDAYWKSIFKEIKDNPEGWHY